jgi:hypothetical protein
MDEFAATKLRDPYIFQKADDFFKETDTAPSGVSQPATVSFLESDQLLQDGLKNPACSHGAIFRLNDGIHDTFLLIQFMRPRVWRVRFDPNNQDGSDFGDYNRQLNRLVSPDGL